METKTQDMILEDADYDSTFGNLLTILQSEEADLLDKVLLEMLVEDVKDFLEAGETGLRFEDIWAALEEWKLPGFVAASLRSLPQLVSCPDTAPSYHHKFALNILAVMVQNENIFKHLQTQHMEALSAVAHASEVLDVNAALCLPLAAVISACLQHTSGRRWAEQTEVWSGLVAAAVRSGGGRFRPSLCRLLRGRLAVLWAGPAVELAGPLQAVSRFLVVPARRLLHPLETGTPAAWLWCCELLLRLVQQLLRELPDQHQHQPPQTEQHRQVVSALRQQMAVPMELSPAPFIPAQLYVGLHLLDQSASDSAVTSAVQRACRALSRQDRGEALRHITALALDVCLLGRLRCCQLAAVATAPVWAALQRWRAAELTPEERSLAQQQRRTVEEFVSGDGPLSAVLGGPGEDGDLRLCRTVFLSRADRPCGRAADPATLCRLVQPWVLLLKHGLVPHTSTQASTLSLVANLCGPADCSPRSDGVTSPDRRPDDTVTSLTGLEHVIVDRLQGPDVSERVAVCALQCLGRGARLLRPPSADPVWSRLAGLLTARLTEPTGEDSLDAAGEAVTALVRSASHSAAGTQSTNQNTDPTQPTSESGECPLADWLAANRLASCALTSLLRAGPGSRRVAHWLLEMATGPVWKEIVQNVDLAQLLESGADGDVVLDTAPLLYLRRLSESAPARLSAADWSASLPLLQTALCSGESDFRRAAHRVYLAAATNDLSRGSAIPAETAVSWLRDGTGRALLSLASDTLPASSRGHRRSSPRRNTGGTSGTAADRTNITARRAARGLVKRMARVLSDSEKVGDDTLNCDRLEPGGLETVRRLCGQLGSDAGVTKAGGELHDCHAAQDGESHGDQTAVNGGSRDSVTGLDRVSREAVISTVLAQSTEEFFGGRVGGGGGGAARLRRRPEVGLSLSEFLAAAAALETLGPDGKGTEQEGTAPAMVALSEPASERREALVRRVAARVEEVFRCAVMDRKTDIPTDCY